MKKTAKKEVIRARCSPGIKSTVQIVAAKLGLDESDIVRIAVVTWLKNQTQAS